MPVNPISAGQGSGIWSITSETNGAEWTTGAVAEGPAAAKGSGFGSMLADQLKSLETTQNKAAEAAQSLATGEANDPTAAIVAVDIRRDMLYFRKYRVRNYHSPPHSRKYYCNCPNR